MLWAFATLWVMTGAQEECNPSKGAPVVGLSMVTSMATLPGWSRNDSVLWEHLEAVAQNAALKNVDEVLVVVERAPPEVTQIFSVAERNERATTHLRSLNVSSKVRAHVFGRRPSYSELLRFASSQLPNKVVAVTRAHVVLRNAHVLDAAAFQGRPLVVALAATPGACHNETPWWCDDGKWTGLAFDGFIFRAPLPARASYWTLDEQEPTPIFLNDLGAGYRAMRFFTATGYDAVNPCKHHIADHFPAKRCNTPSFSDHRITTEVPVGWARLEPKTMTRGLLCDPAADTLRHHPK